VKRKGSLAKSSKSRGERSSLSAIIARFGAGSRTGFALLDDVRDEKLWLRSDFEHVWLSQESLPSKVKVGDVVGFEVAWLRKKGSVRPFAVTRCSILRLDRVDERKMRLETQRFNSSVAFPYTYLSNVRDAKEALEVVQFTPTTRLTKREIAGRSYCPFCRTERGLRLRAWPIRTTKGEIFNWQMMLDHHHKQHTKGSCRGNIKTVLLRLRGNNQIRRASRVAFERRRPGDCSEREWQHIVEHQGRKCFDCGEKKPLTKGHLIPVAHPNASHNPENIVGQCRSCNSKQNIRIHVEAVRRKLVTAADVREWKDKRERDWSMGDGRLFSNRPPAALYRPARRKSGER
jgi:5-methylcytosine-specific restriction endonuclease McrA